MSIMPFEAPATAEAAPTASQPQRSLNGVLNWLVEQTPEAVSTAANDTDAPNHLEEMDAERREFLQKVLGEMESSDYLASVKTAIQLLTEPEAPLQARLDAMDDIAEQCEDLNVAQDFVTIGGLPVITTNLLSTTPEVKWRAADIVAILTENHPKCQEQSHANNIMSLVVPLLKHDNDKVRLKAIRAISSMTRGSQDLQDDFLQHEDAIPSLVACVHPDHVRVSVKAIVMCTHLLRMDPALGDKLVQAGLVNQLSTTLLRDEDAQLWEYALQTMTQLQATNNAFISTVQQDQPQLVQALQARQQVLGQLPQDDKDARREEMNYLTLIFQQAQL
eukprot:m.40937 g.40937  ORF g.40937 m.40937 type:complete len:333 (-) comp12791_c0_seq1:24-1022(-)